MLTSPPKPQPVVGLAGMNILQMLELASKPAEMKQMLAEIAKAEETLAANRSAARKEQTQLLEAERQLSERKANIDAEWARLKAEQLKLDEAKVAYKHEVEAWRLAIATSDEKATQHADRLYEYERKLKARESELDKREASIAASEADREVAWVEREAVLDNREVLVAAREKAADELSAMLAKVKG